MRIFSIALLLFTSLPTVLAGNDEPLAPPKRLRGEWSDLSKAKFNTWIIKSVSYDGKVADGGSEVYSLTTATHKRFDLVVANRAYWSQEDIKLNRQVFYLIYDKRFYRVDINSKGESDLLAMLEVARKKLTDKSADELTLYSGLIARIRNRISAK